jgi:Holliday junction resolvase
MMVNVNGRKGALFETAVMKWLRLQGLLVERLTKAGAKDEGDLVVIVAGQSYILELKNRAKLDLPTFWSEAITEAKNYANARSLDATPPSYVVVKRRNAGIDQSWVIQSLEQWTRTR